MAKTKSSNLEMEFDGPGANKRSPSLVSELSPAIWFLEKIGDLERAKALLEIADDAQRKLDALSSDK